MALGEGHDDVYGAIPLDAWGPEQRLPPSLQAWLDPAQPLPAGVALIGLGAPAPLWTPLITAALLGSSAGALAMIVAKEAAAGQWVSAGIGLGVTVLVVVAALAFARRGLAGAVERWGGARRARRGIFLGAAGGEPVLLVRARAGEARLWPRSQVRAARAAPGEGGGAPVLELQVSVGPDRDRRVALPGAPEGGAPRAARRLQAWLSDPGRG